MKIAIADLEEDDKIPFGNDGVILPIPETRIFRKRTNYRKIKKQLKSSKCKNCFWFKNGYCIVFGEENILPVDENQTCTNFLKKSKMRKYIKGASKCKSIREDKYIQRKRSHIIRYKK